MERLAPIAPQALEGQRLIRRRQSRRSATGQEESMLPRVFACAYLLLQVIAPASAATQPHRAWTVMVYMNAKNNLESDALENFLEMASVGSTREVALVTELGRPAQHYSEDYGGWSGVRRFYVTHGSTPTAEAAIMDLATAGLSTDMASGKTLGEFVEWGRATLQADHYLLIIWNHGQGWRDQFATSRAVREAAAQRAQHAPPPVRGPASRPTASFRSVSYDEDTGHVLYNRDIQDTLAALPPLEVIGFDACLMSMLETAYALRQVASYMVASEELEPAAGWPYGQWFKKLTTQPKIGPRSLASLLVHEYRLRYGDTYKTTLSAIDLQKVSSLAKALSVLSDAVDAKLEREMTPLAAARGSCRAYGEDAGLHFSVDLRRVLDRYAAATQDSGLKEKTAGAIVALEQIVVANYTSIRLKDEFGSAGISIYFPESKTSFEADAPASHGYLADNASWPVEFVQKESWARLLRDYLRVP
jgi:hypothetical protein